MNGRNDIDYPERVRMDSWYVRNWSVSLDLVLLAKTVGVVLEKKAHTDFIYLSVGGACFVL